MKALCADYLLLAEETGYEVPFSPEAEREKVRVLRDALIPIVTFLEERYDHNEAAMEYADEARQVLKADEALAATGGEDAPEEKN